MVIGKNNSKSGSSSRKKQKFRGTIWIRRYKRKEKDDEAKVTERMLRPGRKREAGGMEQERTPVLGLRQDNHLVSKITERSEDI